MAMKYNILSKATLAAALMAMAGCTQDAGNGETGMPADAGSTPMTFSVSFAGQDKAPATRVTGTAFDTGDRIGLYVAKSGSPLETGGNLVNNEAITFNGSTWAAGRTLYWNDGTYNAYAYYPYSTPIESIEDMPFSVQTDQWSSGNGTAMGGYEASDFLYAQTKGVAASAGPIPLTFAHIMSKLTVRLVKGEDFEGEMPATSKVYIHNVVTDATIDLSAGVATRNMRAKRNTVTARQTGSFTHSAIIVPQRIDNRMPLVEVEMKGVSYMFESKFQFKPGVEHLINLIISDNPDNIKIEIGGEIQDWE